jgi:hypothetical protein
MRKAFVSIYRYLLVLGLGLAGVTCSGESTGPSGGHEAFVRVRPLLSAAAVAANVPLTQARLVVVRLPAETLAVQSGSFTVADTSVAIVAPVELDSVTEELRVTLELSTATGAAFRGIDTMEVTSGAPAPVVAPMAVRYVGPGVNAASVRITPRDSTLAAGDTLFFVVTGTDSAAGTIPAPYVFWSTPLAGASLQQTGRLIGPAIRTSGFVRVVTPTGLTDSARVTFLPPPTQIAMQSGDLQTGAAGDTLALDLIVVVRAADSLPVRGVRVTFAATAGGGNVLTSSTVTDGLGFARSFVRLGTSLGENSFTATVAGLAPVTFTATAQAGAPATIAKQGGDAQVDTAGKALALPFLVRITDANANPVTGAIVIWDRRVGSGDVSPDTSVTDTLGLARANYTLGNAGTDTVRANLGGTGAFVEFRAIALPGATVVTLTSGTAQTDTVAQLLTDSLVVTLTDQGTAAPLAGRAVTWTVLTGTATLSDDTVTSNGTGRAGIRVTLGQTPGPVTIRATTAGAVVPVTFTATAVAGAPQHLTFLVAPPDTAAAGAVIVPAIVVEVRDTFDNPVQRGGIPVRALMAGVTAVGGRDSVVTDTTGRATFDSLVISGAVGNDELRFDAPGLVASRKTLHLRAGAAAAIATVAGDSQTAYVDSVVVTRPRARVTDAYGNLVPAATVQWVVVAGGGSLTGATGPTDTLGEAAVGSWRLGATPGTNTLRARVAGVDSVEFQATGDPLPPAITLTLRDTIVGTGRTVGLEIRLAEPAPAGGVTVALTNSVPGVMTLDSAAFSFAQGDTLRVATLTGVTGGTTIIGSTAPGYLADTITVRGTANVITVPGTFTVAYLNNGNLTVQLAAPAPAGGVTVTVASLDTTKVTILIPTVTFNAGELNKITQVRGVRPGNASVVTSAPGFLPDTADVHSAASLDILAGGLQALDAFPALFVSVIRSAGNVVVAPPGGIIATLTSRNPACVVTDSVITYVSGNAPQDTARIGAGPFPCQTYVVASAPGLAPDSVLVQADSLPAVQVAQTALDVGAGLQRSQNVNLSYAQHGGRHLVVRSLSPSKVVAQVNATTPGSDTVAIFLPNGTQFTLPFLAGVEGVADTASVVFEMAGYRPDTILVTVRPAFVGFNGIVPTRPTTMTDSDVLANTGISINSSGITNLQALRAGGTISHTATFHVKTASGAVRLYDTTGVRDTVVTAVIPNGLGSTPVFGGGGVRIDAVAPGVDTIYVTLPGATTVPASAALRINVTPGVITLADTVVKVGAGLFTKNPTGLDGHLVSVGGTGHQGATLTLHVLEPGIALLQPDDTTVGSDSITVTIPAGVASGRYYVAGVEGVINDTVLVVVTAPGLIPDTVKVIVLRPGLDLQTFGMPATVGVGTGPYDLFASIGLPNAAGTAVATPQAVRPGSGLSGIVTFSLDIPGIAQIVDQTDPPAQTKTRTIPVGGTITPFRIISGGVGLAPLAPGGVTVSVATPGATTLTGGARAVTVTP